MSHSPVFPMVHSQLSNSIFRKLKLMNPYLRKAKFFLVRSVFEENIEIAQDKSVWATLPHNEKKFNHAFSVRRYFIFSRKRLLQVFTKILSFRLSKMYFCFLLWTRRTNFVDLQGWKHQDNGIRKKFAGWYLIKWRPREEHSEMWSRYIIFRCVWNLILKLEMAISK